MRDRINLNDVIYKLRHGTAEEKIVIEEITDLHAKTKDGVYKFLRTQIEPIQRIHLEFGYSNIFGESYVLKTSENEHHMERNIKLRLIRNYAYSLLTDQQINELLEVIKKFEE